MTHLITTPSHPVDQAEAGTPGSGENVCQCCHGTGVMAGATECENCGGTGKVIEGVGGG